MPARKRRVARSRNAHLWYERRRRELLFPSTPAGPFCFLRQGRHNEPFAKRDSARRAERKFKRQQREITCGRERDDGWFAP